MKLNRIDGLQMLKLDLGNGHNVTFLKEWFENLRNLPVDEYGSFMRNIIYPELPARDRRSWDRSRISSRDLHAAIQGFKKEPLSGEKSFPIS